MEILFWVGMYVLVALLFYLGGLHNEWDQRIHNKFGEMGWLVLFALSWPLLLPILPFYGVFKLYEYYKTRKTTE